MVFSSLAFLCIFLPIIFVLHTMIGNPRVRNALLIAASLFFYAYGEPVYLLLLLFSVWMNYLAGRFLGKNRNKVVLAGIVAVNLGCLAVFKYAGFLAELVNLFLPAAVRLPVPQIELPIGISFYTFQALSYVIDVYRGDVRAQKSFSRLLLYISFFPQLIAGPIVKYHDIEEQLTARTVSAEKIKQGIYRFSCGLGKKMIIANAMAYIADAMFSLPDENVGILAGWIGAVSYLMEIYFDFSGYSDMAIGLGHMFGFTFQENFSYPYIADSIQDFWRRWHISLSTWFREYLYIPLGGNREGKVRTIRNRFLVFLATGIWHGANFTFLLWGVYHGLLLMGEDTGVIPIRRCRIRAVRRLYTLCAVTVGFVIFRADTVGQAFVFLKAMIGLGSTGGAALSLAAEMLTPYHIFMFLVAAIGCTPLPARIWKRVGANSAWHEAACMILCMLAVLFSLMSLASDGYNPFIYFRF